MMGNPREVVKTLCNEFVFIALIIGVFYFFMISRKQTRQRRTQFREGLQKGDKVITAGGIHGKIVEVQETTVIIEVLDQVTA